MIPKVAHFHWTGPEMSWLRRQSVEGFERLNPSWKVIVHDTPEEIRKYRLKYHHEADWTWWRKLCGYGGFQVATDIVFVKPIPDGWLDCRLNAQIRGRTIWQFAMLGCVPSHSLVQWLDFECEDMAPRLAAQIAVGRDPYQIMGADLLDRACAALWSDSEALGRDKTVYKMPESALCPVPPERTPELWDAVDYVPADDTIGVHWYGGHVASKANEANAEHGDFAISRLARAHEQCSV